MGPVPVGRGRGSCVCDQLLEVAHNHGRELVPPVPLDRVLAQKAKLDHIVVQQGHVLGTQRRGANRVGFLGVLFIANSKAETIDEIACRGDHARSRLGRGEIAVDALTHVGQPPFQANRLIELGRLTALLDRRGIAEPDVLELAGELVFPARDPHRVGLPDDLRPFAIDGRCVGAQVEGYITLRGALLPAATQGMLTPPHKDAAGLRHIRTELDALPVDDGVSVLLLQGLSLGLAFGGERLAFLFGQPLFGLTFGIDHGIARGKVNLVDPQRWLNAQHRTEIPQKVANKDAVLHIRSVLLLGKGQSHLLLLGSKLDGFSPDDD